MWKTIGRTLISKPLPIDAPAPGADEIAELLDAAEDAYARLLDIKSFWK